MAMAGFDREELQAPLAEINTTPLVDVMLVLLVIFLVTAPMLNNAIKVNLPNEAASEIADGKAAVISLDEKGQYYIDERAITDTELEDYFITASQHNPRRPIHFRADINATYGKISHVLAMAQRLGLHNFGFITEPK